MPEHEQTAAQTPQDVFERAGYVVITGALPRSAADLAYRYALLQAQDPDYYMDEPMMVARGHYADAMGEAILMRLHPLLERATGHSLFPCYSFLRIYQNGSSLPRHVDRPSCEISATLTLGYEGGKLWPIGVESGGRDIAVPLDVGDLMIYRGAEVPHWREAFAGENWIQLFLHYVASDGPYAEYRFDKRERIGPVKLDPHVSSLGEAKFAQPEDPCPCGSGKLYRDCHGR